MKQNIDAHYKMMTETPIPKLITKLGIPTILTMLITNVYNMVDTFFVGQLGTSASGAVGIVFGLMAMLQAFAFMFGHGAGSIVGRRLGQKDVKGASVFASTGFFLSVVFGVVILVLGLCFMTPLVRLLGSTDTILPYASHYAFYILLAAPFIISSFMMNNVLRYEGKAMLGMVGMAAGAVLNMVGDPILMFVFHMGIDGAGLSTALSQVVGFIILLSEFLRGRTQSTLRLRLVAKDFESYRLIVATGFPSLARQGLNSVATMALNAQAAAYGDAAIAAMSIVGRISFFIFAVGLGIGQGYQPVAAFNYGAEKYGRVRQGFKFSAIAGEAMLGVLAVIGMLVAGPLVQIFRDDPAVIATGIVALRWQCAALFFQPVTVMTNMLFQAVGANKRASFIAVLRSGVYFIPLVSILPIFWGITGIESAQAIADVLTFLTTVPFTLAFFRKLPRQQDALPLS